MITRHRTANSVYEIEEVNPSLDRFRRVSGANPATPNFEKDGLWHDGKVEDHPTGLLFVFNNPAKTFTLTTAVMSSEEVSEPA